MSSHQYFHYVPHKKGERIIRVVSLDLINFYFRQKLSRSKWLRQKRLSLSWYTEKVDEGGSRSRKNTNSVPFTILDFEEHIFRTQGFNYDDFTLFSPYCSWLDADVGIGLDFHFADAGGESVKMQTPLPLGSHFPIVPSIDREGHIYSSLQGMLQKSIIETRQRLISESDQFSTPSWFNLLRMYIMDCVSIIDMTLHHIYTKAEFDPLPGWNFDVVSLGDRNGRRLVDKLRWVGQITGNPLNDAEVELKSFHRLREIRNHLQHFDPPCFGLSLEDVTSWINFSSLVGRLAWKIRKKIGSPLTPNLIALIVAPDVCFVPKRPDWPRKAQPADVGYGSTRWPSM